MSWTEEDLAAHYARLKQPQEGASAPSEAPDRLEAPIQAECIQLLIEDGWWPLRTDPVSDRKRGTGFGAIGFADYTVFRPMRVTQLVPLQKMPAGCACEVLFLEFKSPKGSPSKEQLKWHRNQRAMGFATFIAGVDFPPSVQGFKEFYRASGLARREGL